ncbi:MAG: hypothetical protein K0S18_142 [Anaerocolumna sp.]|jgi:hypothetical protein|nr:hypothetical protein [Anaerocolumna sp.]
MQDTTRTNNTIRLFTYDDAIALYKREKRQAKKNTLTAIQNYFIDHYITQKIIGLLILILITMLSLIIQDATALIFMLPICVGLMLANEQFIG